MPAMVPGVWSSGSGAGKPKAGQRSFAGHTVNQGEVQKIKALYSLYYSFEVSESHGSVTLAAQRGREALGQVSLFVYAQNVEAQLGQDYIFTPMVGFGGVIAVTLLITFSSSFLLNYHDLGLA